MSSNARVTLKPRRARPFFAHHPWVFDSSVARVVGEPKAGDPVDVETAEGQFIASGLFNPSSTIRVRLYRWDEGPMDDAFWSSLLSSAVALRHEVLELGGEKSAYRVVFSEGDGISGLTVDRYDRWLVAQFNSLALHARREPIVRHLIESTHAEGAVIRTERGIAQKEGLRSGQVEIVGSIPDGRMEIVENGVRYQVDLHLDQKTGFYVDQRDNRRAVAGYCRGKRVLDLYCFSGAFSLNAVKNGGAVASLGVDSSVPMIERAREHSRLNEIGGIEFQAGDVAEVLANMKSQGVKFDVVICDPPKFARQAKDIDHALKGYLRLNRAALDVLEPGGVLVTCSCSGLIRREQFLDVIATVAEQSGRSIQILEQRGQSPDHPISASCLESDYLKCVICRVQG